MLESLEELFKKNVIDGVLKYFFFKWINTMRKIQNLDNNDLNFQNFKLDLAKILPNLSLSSKQNYDLTKLLSNIHIKSSFRKNIVMCIRVGLLLAY